jgi:conjugative transposon protein TcpC
MKGIRRPSKRTPGTPGPLRRVGQLALWAVVLLLLYRGGAAIVKGEAQPATAPTPRAELTAGTDTRVTAFAVRFARTYLADSSAANLTDLLAEGVTVAGGGPAPAERRVAQAEVLTVMPAGSDRLIVTVQCELENREVQNLAVPIARDSAGEVAAVGAPAFVAAPGKGRTEAEQSQPIPGADAESIRELASRFIETFLSGTSAADLEYLTPPDSEMAPLGGYQPAGSVSVTQIGEENGRSRTVLARVTVHGPNGEIYPLGYRLRLEKRDRWYVTAIEGAMQ